MYSFLNLEQVCCFLSSSNCCFLTCIQVSQKVRWSGIPISLKILHSLSWSTQLKALAQSMKQMFFLKFPCFFLWYNRCWQLDLWSLCLFKIQVYIWKFLVHVLLKPGLKDFERYLASMWNVCCGAVVWTFFGIAVFWDWNENGHFLVLWPLLGFPNLLAYWGQHFNSIIF